MSTILTIIAILIALVVGFVLGIIYLAKGIAKFFRTNQ